MIRQSGIRDKLRSNSLKELAKERAPKRAKLESKLEIDDNKYSDDEQSDSEERLHKIGRRADAASTSRQSKNSLLSMLPKPKKSNAFGPTVRLDKLLKMPERADIQTIKGFTEQEANEDATVTSGEDGIFQVNLSKVLCDTAPSAIKDLTIERSESNKIVVPKGKEKQKNQITYLAQLGKANELERKEQAALGRMNKAAARSRYGW